jgi:hypothetical protein
MTDTALQNVTGLDSLVRWFGRVPRFHDAKLLNIALHNNEPSTLRIHAFQMTDKVDEQGHFVLEKHAVVTLSLKEVTSISLTDFGLPGIIHDLQITEASDGAQITWNSSYGVEGTLRAKRISISLQPGKP